MRKTNNKEKTTGDTKNKTTSVQSCQLSRGAVNARHIATTGKTADNTRVNILLSFAISALVSSFFLPFWPSLFCLIGSIFCGGYIARMMFRKRINLLANVRDHRWLPVARLMPASDSESASGLLRVAIRCIALFDIMIYSSIH
jgi:hypothetical protein